MLAQAGQTAAIARIEQATTCVDSQASEASHGCCERPTGCCCEASKEQPLQRTPASTVQEKRSVEYALVARALTALDAYCAEEQRAALPTIAERAPSALVRRTILHCSFLI